jgi:predicted ATPase
MQREHHALASSQTTGTKQAFMYSLPVSLTSLVGREQEVAQICAWLHRPEVRLLTLTETGGVGKTRLALAIAQHVLGEFPDGVYFVTLAPVSDPGWVTATIAQALSLWEAGDRPLLEQVREYLREKHLLLLLDNFEQVVAAAPQVTDVLTSCPHVSVLVTGRAALHLSGEHEFAVSPLAVPDLAQLPVLADLARVATVRLFVERAQAVKADFQLTGANAHTIAEICIHLDGLPLAIELAAARIKLLPPQALLKRLSHQLDLLTSGAHDLPSRQQKLRNTIQWSYDLLSPQEQGLYRKLSVFVDGCTLEAAEAVCGAGSHQAMEVLERVASLVDKSLLQQAEQVGDEPRLIMLEAIREFGLERLAAHREGEAARDAHASYYLWLAEEAEPYLVRAEQGEWLDRLEREHENLRAALSWLIERGDRETALRLAGALWRFWWMHGHLSEGRGFLEGMLPAPHTVAASIRAKALVGAGVLTGAQGYYAQAETLCAEGLRLFRELEDQRGISTALWMLGRVAYNRSQYAVARTVAEEALALSRQTGDAWGITSSLENLTSVALDEGKYDEARTGPVTSCSMHMTKKGAV